MPTNKNIPNLIINKVENQTVYNYMRNNSLLNEDELYLIKGSGSSVDASSINGLATHLNETCLHYQYGSYRGENIRTNCYSTSALQQAGRQIQLPAKPIKLRLDGSTILRQGDYLTKGVITGTMGNTSSTTYYVALLAGSILYVASYAYYASNTPEGYNSGSHHWEIIY